MAAARNNALNLLSPAFDPILALTAPSVPVPFPDVTPLNNVAECRRLLPPSAASAVAEGDLREAFDASRSSAPAPAASMPRRLSAIMHDELSQGVLAVLWALRKQHVRVLVHRGDGLRGIVEGRLQVYDKHLNLVLRNATEHFLHCTVAASTGVASSSSSGGGSGANGAPGSSAATASWRRRSVAQLLIRGDGVVSVCKRPDACRKLPTAARAAFRARAVLADPRGEAPAEVAAAAAAAAGDDKLEEDDDEGAAMVATDPADDDAVEYTGEEEDDDDDDEDWDDSEHLVHFAEHYCGDARGEASEEQEGQRQVEIPIGRPVM